MAGDPLSREWILAVWMLNRFGLLNELRDQRLGADQLKQQLIQKQTRELGSHLAPGVGSSRTAWNTPAATPTRGQASTEGKNTTCTTATRQSLDTVPDLVPVITAYRAWRTGWLNGRVRLFALGLEVVWEPRQKAEAECSILASLGRPRWCFNEHKAPAFNCRCGIWGFKSIENLLLALGPHYKPSVIGKVSLWGRVIETENGYRAQYAYPEELWAWSVGSRAEELGLVYGVPVKPMGIA